MTLLRHVGMALSVVLVPLTVSAASPPEPRVDYSADSTMEMDEGMTMKSHVYHTSGKERMEMGGADGSVTIIRKDKKVMWQLMGDMYMEMALDQSNSSELSAMDVEQTAVGKETINGVKTTKSKVIATKKDGSKFGGFFWTTKEGDKKVRMASELTNLKIEKQDPALFEIPAGHT